MLRDRLTKLSSGGENAPLIATLDAGRTDVGDSGVVSERAQMVLLRALP
jgi:hypothetical protein